MLLPFEFGEKLAAAMADADAPYRFDTHALVSSLQQFPALVHEEEPGFANTFQNPTLKNMLWRTGALLPIGLSAAGLIGLAALHNSRKKKREKLVLKAAGWADTLQSIKAQFPGVHPIDTAAGAIGGAALGGLYDVLRGNSDRTVPNKRWRSTARRVLSGAMLGGGVANLAGDRARRYISNTLMPFGYDSDRLKNVKPDSFQKVWNAAILDKPTYDLNDLKLITDIGNSGGSIDARREIMRRTFGVHANNAATDWWQKNKNGYYSLNEKHPEYAQRLRLLFGPESVNAGPTVMNRLLQNPQAFLTEYNTQRPAHNRSQANAYDLFSSGQIVGDQQVPFAVRGPRVDAQVLDRFDLTPNPTEKAHLKTWVFNKLRGRDPAWNDRHNSGEGFDYSSGLSRTNEQVAKTLGARWLWENVLSSELPWISQKMTMLPNDPEAVKKNPTGLPYRLQFLRENNKPAIPPITDTNEVTKWINDNPLNKPHPLLAILQEAKEKADAAKAQADSAKK